MEMTLTAPVPAIPRRPFRRQRRLPSAHWWFDQMRKAVDEAIDWPSAPSARSEQTDLRLTSGQIKAA